MATLSTDALVQLQRQLDEIEALRAVFPDETDGLLGGGGCFASASASSSGLLLSPLEWQALELAQQVCQAAEVEAAAAATEASVSGGSQGAGSSSCGGGGSEDSDPLAGLPLLSGTIRPPGLLYGGRPVVLRFTLPRSYPAGSPAAIVPAGSGAGGRGAGARGGGVAAAAAVTAGVSEEEHGGLRSDPRGGLRQPEPHPHPRPPPQQQPPQPPYQHRRASLAVECSAPRLVHERLSSAVASVADREAEAGCECLLLAVDVLKDTVEELHRLEQQQWPAASGAEALHHGQQAMAVAAAAAGGSLGSCGVVGVGGSGGGGGGPLVTDDAPSAAAAAAAVRDEGGGGLLCVLVWLHHLKSLTKRKLIVQWARELGLAGACKPGFPGVVVVEGHSDDVHDFLCRMRALSWQAMQVRGQDLLSLTGPPSPLRSLPEASATAAAGKNSGCNIGISGNNSSGDSTSQRALMAAAQQLRLSEALPFCELEEEGGMSALGALCRAAGLHHVFLTALKL